MGIIHFCPTDLLEVFPAASLVEKVKDTGYLGDFAAPQQWGINGAPIHRPVGEEGRQHLAGIQDGHCQVHLGTERCVILGMLRCVQHHFVGFFFWWFKIMVCRVVYIRIQSLAHVLGVVNGVAFFHFHCWTASINPRLLFSPCKLCFLRTFPFLRLIEHWLCRWYHCSQFN